MDIGCAGTLFAEKKSILLKKVKVPNVKKPQNNCGFLYKRAAGAYLLSHRVTPAVPSAFKGLTSVFGMGTGGSL